MRYAVPEAWHQPACGAGGFMARATSSSPNARRNSWDEDVARQARQLQWTRQIAGARAALRVISPAGGSSSISGIRNGVAIGNSWHEPAIRVAAEQSRRDLDSFAVPFVMRTRG